MRRVEGDADLERTKELWSFKEAPRWMCLESVGKIPDLLDELTKRTEETTKSLQARTTEATEFVRAVKAAGDELEPF
jgi:hypothetical protein